MTSSLDVAVTGERLGHIGTVRCLTQELPIIDVRDLAGLAALDDADREATVETALDALVDVRDWATRLINIVSEAGAE